MEGRAVLTSSTEENSASTAYQLQIVDSAVVFCQVVGGVGSVPGEIEKARRKPCFIESFGYESFFVWQLEKWLEKKGTTGKGTIVH